MVIQKIRFKKNLSTSEKTNCISEPEDNEEHHWVVHDDDEQVGEGGAPEGQCDHL